MSKLDGFLGDGTLLSADTRIFKCPEKCFAVIRSVRFINKGVDTTMSVKLRRKGESGFKDLVFEGEVDASMPADLIETEPDELTLNEGDELLGNSVNEDVVFTVWGYQRIKV